MNKKHSQKTCWISIGKRVYAPNFQKAWAQPMILPGHTEALSQHQVPYDCVHELWQTTGLLAHWNQPQTLPITPYLIEAFDRALHYCQSFSAHETLPELLLWLRDCSQMAFETFAYPTLSNQTSPQSGRSPSPETHTALDQTLPLLSSWIWSGCSGVFSYETALSLYDLCDPVLYSYQLIVPANFTPTPYAPLPPRIQLHSGHVSPEDIRYFGHVPLTTPAATLEACSAQSHNPKRLKQAVGNGIIRDIFSFQDIPDTLNYLAPYLTTQDLKRMEIARQKWRLLNP